LRVQQLQSIELHITGGKPIPGLRVWIGGLFVPEAFITATRQSVAQANNWALEKLSLELDVSSYDIVSLCSPNTRCSSFRFAVQLRICQAA
jgi:hypothetical protein